MTHAECQDLLLDLAYGELDPARAAELSGHLSGCAECQRDKAALDEARRAAAPLRELEEPPASFDEPILAAARAQAQLDHDGDVGQVIEVQGDVRPLEMEAAHIDALGAPAVRERRRPRWALRLALGGSVAGAAALALVVSTTLQSRREAEQAAARAAAETPFEIHVQAPQPPAPQAADEAYREAKKAEPAKPVQRVAAQETRPPAPVSQPAQKREAPTGTVARERAAAQNSEAPAAPKRAPVSPPEQQMNGLGAPAAVPPAAPAPAAPPPAAAKSLAVENADDLEQAASTARHAGDYLRAAALYRQASAARRAAGESSGDGAWDLAHAVECLASVGQFDEARKVRAQLAQLYPSEATAFAAAARALRSADVVSSPAETPARK